MRYKKRKVSCTGVQHAGAPMTSKVRVLNCVSDMALDVCSAEVFEEGRQARLKIIHGWRKGTPTVSARDRKGSCGNGVGLLARRSCIRELRY